MSGPRRLAALALLAVILGSGCLGPLLATDEEAEEAAPPAPEDPGSASFGLSGAPAYQVANLEARGRLELQSAAALALYDPEDRRVAFADGGPLNATLALSGDYVVVAYPLGAAAEARYHPPANRTGPFREPGVVPLETFQSRGLVFDGDLPSQLPGAVSEFEKTVRLALPPVHLAFGHVGYGTTLAVEVRSAAGHVLSSQAGPLIAAPPGSLGPDPFPFTPWAGDVQPEELANLEGLELDVQGATDLVGQVYLLATAYARHPAVLLFPSPVAPEAAAAQANASAADEAEGNVGNVYYQNEVEAGSAYAFEIPEGAEGLAVLPLPQEAGYGFASEETSAEPSLLALYGADEALAAILVVTDATSALQYAFEGEGRHVVHPIRLASAVQLAPIGATPTDVHLHELDLERETVTIEVAPGLEGPVAVKRTANFDRPPIGVEYGPDWGATWSDFLLTLSREGGVESQCGSSSTWSGFFSPQCSPGGTDGMDRGPGLLAGAHQMLLQATDFQGTLRVTFHFFEAAAATEGEPSAPR